MNTDKPLTQVAPAIGDADNTSSSQKKVEKNTAMLSGLSVNPTSVTGLNTSHFPNQSKANSEGRTNQNAALSDSSSNNINLSIGTLSSTSEPVKFSHLSNLASAELIEKNKENVLFIINDMDELKNTLIKDDKENDGIEPNEYIQLFKKAIALLNYLDPSSISMIQLDNEISGDNSIKMPYNTYYKDDLLFTVTITRSYDSIYMYGERYTDFGAIKISNLFNELFYYPGAPGYLLAKSSFYLHQNRQNIYGISD